MSENQVTLSMITDDKKWHYFAVESLSRLLHRITSKHNDDHYYMKGLHSFRTESKLRSHKIICKNHNNCSLKMPKSWNKILNPLSANNTKWSKTLKQFVGNLPTNCLSLFDHFVELALKGLSLVKIKNL